MSDYISREAVFQVVHGIARGIDDKYIEALKAKDTRAFYKAKGAKEILDSVATDLCYIPAADVQPVNQWISVKDRLPEPGQNVLIYYPHWEGDEIQTAKFSENKLWFEICGEFDVERNSATHWQPLPEPPKKENDNDT